MDGVVADAASVDVVDSGFGMEWHNDWKREPAALSWPTLSAAVSPPTPPRRSCRTK